MPKTSRGLQDPVKLKSRDKETGLYQVIVETPKGSRNKFAYDPELRIFALKKVLPAGMTFPYEFGFIPQTKAGDGDPIDVLLLMDEPAYPGIAVQARLIGVIEGSRSMARSEFAMIAFSRSRMRITCMPTFENWRTCPRSL